MRDYGKVSPQFWIGETGKLLRGNPEAQVLALYLMTNPHATMTGVFHCPVIYMAHETGLSMEGASKGLARLIEAGFCEYDEASESVFVVNMAAFQIDDCLKPDDKRVLGLRKEVAKMLPARFQQRFAEVYGIRFHLAKQGENNSPLEAPSKPLPSQEQEQEQEQEIKALSGNPDPLPEKPKKQTRTTEAKELLAYMNQVCGSRFQPVAANLNLITARLNEGATSDDVKAVIDRKQAEWCNDDAMRKYLRPETLFNATKFAGYLGMAGAVQAPVVTTTPEDAKRKQEWAAFEYAVRSFRETVWPDGMEADRLRRAAEIQEIADSFGVTFERPLLEVAA